MSIELYLQGFRAGEPAGVPLQVFCEIFDLTDPSTASERFLLDYGTDGDCEMSLHLEGEDVVAAVIFRPVEAARLWAQVFEVLERGPYVAFTSEGATACVREEVAANMPTDMVESLGEPTVVRSVEALTSALFD